MPKTTEGFNWRDCKACGAPVIDVVDEFTGATFPVDRDGAAALVLRLPDAAGGRNAIAERAVVHQPHLPNCGQRSADLGEHDG